MTRDRVIHGAPKGRNPEARALANPLFRKRVVPSAKVYKRRERGRGREE